MIYQRSISALRERGMTLVELLVVVAIIGIVANVVVPNFIGGMVKSHAIEIIGEYKLVQLAANTFWADTGSPPRFWTASSHHPDLESYLADGSFPQVEGVGLQKHYVRYEEPEESWGFRAGYLVRSTSGASAIIQAIEREFDGPIAVLRPGREVLLVTETYSGDDDGSAGSGGGTGGGGGGDSDSTVDSDSGGDSDTGGKPCKGKKKKPCKGKPGKGH